MWILNGQRYLKIKVKDSTNPCVIYYTAALYYTFSIFGSKYFNVFAFSTHIGQISLAFLKLSAEYQIVRFKYVGKAYRISKRKKILHVNMHYPTYKCVVWNNIKLKHKRKKKKLFEFKYNTLSNVKSNFWKNMLRLRILNTYTARGIHNNLLPYYKRKTRIVSRR